MLDRLRAKPDLRKLRLLACAYCRRVWHDLTGDDRGAVEAAERFADGLAGAAELRASTLQFREDPYFAGPAYLGEQPRPRAYAAANAASEDERDLLAVARQARGDLAEALDTAEAATQAGLVRCVFGSPSRPFTLAPG